MINQPDYQIIKDMVTEALQDSLKDVIVKSTIEDIMLTPDEVVGILKVERSKLLRRIPLKKYYVGKEVRYKLAEVNQYLRSL